MNIEQAAGQVMVVGFEGTTLPTDLDRWLRADTLAGLILFSRNIDDPHQAHDLIDSATNGELPPLVCVDQEGGRVERLKAPVLELPPMRDLGTIGDAELTQQVGFALGRQLAAVGFNMNFAPVLDVDSNPDNPIIGDRAFGPDVDTVTTHAYAFAEGLRHAGILACGKHFPGHGDTDLDSHLALPTVNHDRARLARVELAPFGHAVGRLPALMTAHVVFEALDPGVPATLSHQIVTGVLRQELNYGGVVISDDLEMKAVADTWGVVDAGIEAIAAGCDIVLVCSDVSAASALRDALIEEAESSSIFNARLKDAAARSRRLRRSILPQQRANLDDVLGDQVTTSVLDKLNTRLDALGLRN